MDISLQDSNISLGQSQGRRRPASRTAMGLKVHKSMGPGEIHPQLQRGQPEEMAKPLCSNLRSQDILVKFPLTGSGIRELEHLSCENGLSEFGSL